MRKAVNMGSEYHFLAGEACRLAKVLPSSVIEAIAKRLEQSVGTDRATARGRIVQALAGPHHRALVAAFLDRWNSQAPTVLPQAVAAALLTASEAERGQRETQTVELVWTGPDVGVVPLRRTEQAILQVIDSASQRITLVSYAVYHIRYVCEALVRAAGRGTRIDVIVETPNKLEGENEYNTIRALGDGVAACSTLYYWPKEQRARDSSGKLGILHVKCVVADGQWVFLSSANLTDYAFTINMELGLLITGGDLPARIERHFDRLIDSGTLEKL
jgi:phosphatidylserine/phosphatidylglycerophosphate/cardiolipin synthase-like enzyme